MASRPARHSAEAARAASAFLVAGGCCSIGAPKRAIAQSLQDKIAQCAACHGEDGQSKDPNIPHIGGQPKLFVMYQLFFYREGRRKSAEMNIDRQGTERRGTRCDIATTSPSCRRRRPLAAPRRGPLSARRKAGAGAHLRELPQPRLFRPRADAPPRRPAPEYTLKALQDYRARHPHRHAGGDAGNGARPRPTRRSPTSRITWRTSGREPLPRFCSATSFCLRDWKS